MTGLFSCARAGQHAVSPFTRRHAVLFTEAAAEVGRGVESPGKSHVGNAVLTPAWIGQISTASVETLLPDPARQGNWLGAKQAGQVVGGQLERLSDGMRREFGIAQMVLNVGLDAGQVVCAQVGRLHDVGVGQTAKASSSGKERVITAAVATRPSGAAARGGNRLRVESRTDSRILFHARSRLRLLRHGLNRMLKRLRQLRAEAAHGRL